MRRPGAAPVPGPVRLLTASSGPRCWAPPKEEGLLPCRSDQKDFYLSTGFLVRRKILRTACSAVKNSPHADPERCRSTPQGKDRHNACGASRISTHGPPGQHLQTSKEEIDVTPAVREKIPHTAHRNDAQPDNKPRIPRTDPGKSGNPATHRRRLSAHQKTTHVFPA
ncbi:hypothetical protein NDU88_006954 [Pleurodeles waltl]|uniref:Uncharacterized protein n=1 Tax=Pleurodeles waltl TaxID=8319 RepID=A0AAV7LTF1_PLEWA|nr:hypothetical protein NDU88_006954 [Pleurodeles waltl]